MRKILSYSIIAIVIFLSVFVSACGGTGVTETGNPKRGVFDGAVDTESTSGDSTSSDDAGTSSPSSVTDETSTLLNAVCGTIEGCYSNFLTSTCLSSLRTDLNALSAFGVNTGTYDTFTAVQTAIDANQLSVSSSELSSCKLAIEDISCSEMDGLGVFVDSNASDYSLVYFLIPEDDC